jgi:hypothetical protein
MERAGIEIVNIITDARRERGDIIAFDAREAAEQADAEKRDRDREQAKAGDDEETRGQFS